MRVTTRARQASPRPTCTTIASILLAVSITSCGGGGGGGEVGGGGTQSPPDISGSWEGTWVSTMWQGDQADFQMTVAHDTGTNEVSGSVQLYGDSCMSSASISGSISGLSLVGSVSDGYDIVSFSMTLDAAGQEGNGTYSMPESSWCDADSGTVTMHRASSSARCAEEGSSPGMIAGSPEGNASAKAPYRMPFLPQVASEEQTELKALFWLMDPEGQVYPGAYMAPTNGSEGD